MRRTSFSTFRLTAAVAALIVALLWATPGQAQMVKIPVVNPSFTQDTLNCSPGSGCNQYGISAWVTGPQTFILKAGQSQYPSAPPGGLYLAALGTSSATGSIFQQLSATVQANTTYTVKITVGARLDDIFTGYEASLLSGGVPLASSNSAIPVSGTFVTDKIVYSSGATPAQLGQPLQIFIKSMGNGQTNIANVVANSAPTAE